MSLSSARFIATAIVLGLLAVAPFVSAQSVETGAAGNVSPAAPASATAFPAKAATSPAGQANTDTLESYVGNYQLEQAVVTISRKGDKLTGSAPGQPDVEFEQLEPALFFVRKMDTHVRFEKNAEGVIQMTAQQGGRTIVGKRL